MLVISFAILNAFIYCSSSWTSFDCLSSERKDPRRNTAQKMKIYVYINVSISLDCSDNHSVLSFMLRKWKSLLLPLRQSCGYTCQRIIQPALLWCFQDICLLSNSIKVMLCNLVCKKEFACSKWGIQNHLGLIHLGWDKERNLMNTTPFLTTNHLTFFILK